MKIMSRFVTFKKLKEKYTLAEIFEFLQAGLKPLNDPSLKAIRCPHEHHRCTVNQKTINYLLCGYFCDLDSDQIIKLKKEIKDVEAKDRWRYSWVYFVPPDGESEKEELAEVISILQNAI